MPRIACLPNGPYYLLFDDEPYVVPYVWREDGSECTALRAVALCRCGGSKTKPLCDGTHGTIGFSDARLGGGPADRRQTYVGKCIAIHDNRSLCAHVAHCTEGLPAVFREEGRPWIDADGASVEEIVAPCGPVPQER